MFKELIGTVYDIPNIFSSSSQHVYHVWIIIVFSSGIFSTRQANN